MRVFIVAALVVSGFSVLAQEDTTRVLDEVVVKAYRANRPLKDVPVTMNVLDKNDLLRFGPASLVTTVNTVPGVRMEERSPGSYRFSIRGSVLRSPFGIRNVKFYWRGLPFTDGGGNTYLNLIDMSTIGKMEIIKGPAASLYGANTGGAVLLDAPTNNEQFTVSMLAGSYGLSRFASQITAKPSERSTIDVGLSNQHSDGYRAQTALDRMNVRINYDQAIGKKGKLLVTYLGAKLNYGTPGGLTKIQYDTAARMARPGTKATPSAEAQKATIYNTTNYLGTVYQHDWNEHWSSSIGVYGSITDFKNPAILNYEHRNENNVGGRTENQYTFGGDEQKGKITFGAEYQMFFGPDRVYFNNSGDRGDLKTDDRLKSRSFITFAQFEYQLPWDILMTAGGSFNFLTYDFNRKFPTEYTFERNFKPGFFPRVALIKKIVGDQLSIYSSVSEGFSAPTLAEVLPSTSILNRTLNPEKGTSVEVGIRSELFNRQIRLNVAAYDFRLRQTIVVRTDNSGADYFTNAGATSQKGIESTIAWTPTWGTQRLDMFRLWMSYTYTDYQFLNYQSGTTDLSGNRLTGVPPTTVVSGLDVMFRSGWYFNVTMNYTDHIPVNDANTEYAHDYKIFAARVGKQFNVWKFRNVEIFAGIDNAFNQKYSLGNDLNAAAGRYYNVAPGRNFYAGLTLPLLTNFSK
jgi:iron complex outermembrane receptor protein